ncbi:MAG: 2-polyprenyl-6-hydroxyphenyl methylase/3-demethylubiquinone-9 3-methyltransferase [Dasania sp.]|jgi:2-polyprenyl-6-hydroxyphenyl methylase/3-demethylubiquinone-9 3-methyltransferase
MNSTISPEEVEKFSAIADQWWDPNGKFKPLHEFNPLRLTYIRNHIEAHFNTPLKDLKLLDIGCGGGLLSEPMARLGLQVTGVDASEKNIKTASVHAEKSNLNINYIASTAETLAIERPEYFDIILNMEVIEHVADTQLFIDSCLKMLKPNGIMVIATLNRTVKSYIFAIVGAEYILRWLPIGTHEWEKFLKPSEINNLCGNQAKRIDIKGANFNILNKTWSQSPDTDVNYMAVYEKNIQTTDC